MTKTVPVVTVQNSFFSVVGRRKLEKGVWMEKLQNPPALAALPALSRSKTRLRCDLHQTEALPILRMKFPSNPGIENDND
jgi:hypothetical protein